LGLEHHNQVCTVWRAEGEPSQQPECVYDDARQEQLHEQFVADQEFRLAVYEELSRRVTNGLEAVHEAEAILDSLRASSSRTAQHPDPGEETAAERNAKVVHQAWRIAAAGASVDLRPALHSPAFPIGGHLQFPPEQYNAQTLQAELESAKFRLREVARELDELRVREFGHAYSGGGIG
jgi:hypothetical protein